MPVTPTYPGVYIEEIPSGVRTITGVSTSASAFVDFFPRGPLGRAVQLFSQADFDRAYGGLDTRSEASYAIRQYFLNGGGEAWVVRAGSDETDAAITNAAIAIRAGTSGGEVLRLRAASPGRWGNALRARVDPLADPARFDLTITESANDGTALRQEVFRNLTMNIGAENVTVVVNDSSQLIQVETATGAVAPQGNGTFSGEFASFSTIAARPEGRSVQVAISGVTAAAELGVTAIASLREARDRFQNAIRAARPDKRTFAEAMVEIIQVTGGNPRLRVLAGPGLPTDRVQFTAVASDPTAGALNLTGTGVVTNVQAYTAGAAVVDTGQAAGTEGKDGGRPNAAALQTALLALKDVSFNLLCIPRTADLENTAARQVIAAATVYCEQRRAFYLVDVPVGINTVQEVKDWIDDPAAMRSRNAAVYFPRVRIADPLNGFRLRTTGASGTVAGVYARTDSERGVWKGPAGADASLRGVQALEYVLNDAETGTLNPLGINTLRSFPVYGTVAWGARTLRGADALADEYKYVPVRRLALYLEESLYRGTHWVVFEPNDEPLWGQIRLNLGAFMHTLFRQGAFQGASPREAYFVKCDKETTTQNDIDLGIVNIVVGFAPLKPAEFVIIKIQQIAGQLAA